MFDRMPSEADMNFEDFARKFGEALKKGDVLEVSYRQPEVDGQKSKRLYYFIKGVIPNRHIGPFIWVSDSLKDHNHSNRRLILNSDIEDISLYRPASEEFIENRREGYRALLADKAKARREGKQYSSKRFSKIKRKLDNEKK